MGEVKVKRYRLDRARAARVDAVSSQTEAEVVAQAWVGRVVVEEVAEVEQHSTLDAVEDVRRMAGDQRRSSREQVRGRAAECRTGAPRSCWGPSAGRRAAAGRMRTPDVPCRSASPASRCRARRMSAYATPGWCGAAAYSAGWSLNRHDRDAEPPTCTCTGRRAVCASSPAPATAIPAARRCSSVSSRARAPKSSAWLLARVTQRAPSRSSASTAAGGARKKKHPGPASGAPRSEMQHSRFSTRRSASSATSTRSGENSRCRSVRGQPLCNSAAEHRVPGKCNLDPHTPSPPRSVSCPLDRPPQGVAG